MPRDVSYTQHPLGGVTEHRVRAATQARPPPVTLALLALHGLVAWRLWQADWSLSLGSVAAARASLASVQAALLVVYLWLLLRISDTSLHDSVTVLPGLGVQVTSARRRFFQTKTSTRFIPAKDLCSVVICEGLSKWNVHYYLGIVTGPDQPSRNRAQAAQDEGRIVVAFKNVRPPLSILKQVYHAVQLELRMDTNAGDHDRARPLRDAESQAQGPRLPQPGDVCPDTSEK